jgi:cytochrome c553
MAAIRPSHPAIGLSLLLLLGGCTWGIGGRDTETTLMHRRFSRTFELQTGIIQGDLGKAKAGAAWLVEGTETEGVSTATEEHLTRLRGYAALISQAETIEAAARQTGQLAGACGDCHKAARGGPHFVIGTDMPEGMGLTRRMIRHFWAADRMWEGLVGPSEEAWAAGASALDAEWVLPEVLEGGAGSVETAEAYARKIRELAGDAQSATRQEERASVYGALLGTCNGCHQAAGVVEST